MTNQSARKSISSLRGIVIPPNDHNAKPDLAWHPEPHPLVVEVERFCEAGDVDNTLAALDRCLDAIDKSLTEYNYLLSTACGNGHAALVHALLDRGLQATPYCGKPAITSGNVEILEMIKNAGWDHLADLDGTHRPGPL
jgi:hypothetical protein